MPLICYLVLLRYIYVNNLDKLNLQYLHIFKKNTNLHNYVHLKFLGCYVHILLHVQKLAKNINSICKFLIKKVLIERSHVQKM